MSPSLVKMDPCDAHQWVNVGRKALASGFGALPSPGALGLRQVHLTSLCLSFSAINDMLTYLTGVL